MIRVCVPQGSSHGWGICGANLIKELQKLAEIGMITDPKLSAVIAVTGPNFMPLQYVPAGPRNAGLAFIEQPSVAAAYVKTYDTYYTDLICGSAWMAQEMKAIGIKNTHVALQGVDFDIFKPTQDRIGMAEPFTVFSGGKFEYRKGQDIVIAAMTVFMDRHKDARLVAAWANIWPETMQSMERSKWIKYRTISSNWKTQVVATLELNGFDMDRVTIPAQAINSSQVDLYNLAHVGLFPNRCEAGNNMVMTEAISSGLLCFGTMGTGHLDLGNCYGHLAGVKTQPDGWMEPESLDEILSILEVYYARRDYIELTRDRNAEAIRGLLSWQTYAATVLEVLTQ